MTALVEPATLWLRDINRFVDRETRVDSFVPPADVLVDDDGVTVHMDVPGVPRDRLDVEFVNDIVTVRGERQYPYGDDDSGKRAERGFGAFERTLRVTDDLDPNRIDATLQDGVLTLRLPKSEARKPSRIEVQAGERGST
ncbi:MAG TPA: Hsp20/alpha crystallin family protein [Solirubrobacteraceae bacterium]|jgi:HSP20 family protein|nr:Hsp20/alpha crystallin family protein [Solirubrobacteraceae bacterium]